MKEEIKVTFNTLTPLWTGDAWQDNNKIRPSSLIGSLRFWFEVICYFSGICDEKDFNNGRFEKEVNRKNFKDCLLEKGNSFEAKIKCLLEQGIPLPSIIFGATNWKSLIEINQVEFFKNNFKRKPAGKIIPNKNWYFGKPSYQGEFSVIFNVEEKILESIFYPLLTFMDKYGFWGGKWNIGYGRLKIEKVKNGDSDVDISKYEEFKFNEISDLVNNKKFRDFIDSNISDFGCLTQRDKKIKLLKNIEPNNDSKKENEEVDLIKELLKIKSKEREKFNTDTEERHKIFGTTKAPPNDKNLLPQGSKILPYIYEEQGKLKGGFLSISGLLNLEGGSNE
ncbi:type III-B CRISPR module RAMP protein Cmr1 [Desulfurobacterium indicum]|uniref:Type III-B CRISPR module RAMP protein Cmr1 n=1 Tax=Desulfurobacterium indicum TaxID=1914305 RepID=A0A1R1MJ72_9BACT|nr:type III-B CRISPR module RAMP protein Cmr1 [Desulfurobacterium indicum]OMH39862.1 type III-B CRISPR module RAMP protein Cmr1 [Desulfurobacterium indicum]